MIIYFFLSILSLVVAPLCAMDNPLERTDTERALIWIRQAEALANHIRHPELSPFDAGHLEVIDRVQSTIRLLADDVWDMVHINRLIASPLVLATLLKVITADKNPRLKKILIDFAITSENNEALAILIFSSVNPHEADQSGETPLHKAAIMANVPAAQLLLTHGAAPYAKTEAGLIALDLAHMHGESSHIVQLLLSQGTQKPFIVEVPPYYGVEWALLQLGPDARERVELSVALSGPPSRIP